MKTIIEENRFHPRLAGLLAAYHLASEAEKGTSVTTVAGLPAVYRSETENPAAAFAADTVLLATPAGSDAPGGCVVLKAPREGRAPEIKRLWVAPEARGKALAAALMDEALRRAAAGGATAVRLTVWDWRKGPLALYLRRGFEIVDSWDERPGLLCLEKRLAPADALAPAAGRVGPRTSAANAADPLAPADAPATSLASAPSPDRVERLTPDAVRAHASAGLAALLVDAVDGGASVGFLAPLDPADAAVWWSGVAEEVATGVRDVWAAHGPDGRLTGVVTLVRTGTANGRHRGEIARLLVHRAARGRGLGRRLLAAAEAHAAATGLTLLVLDTQTDSPAERLYRGTGWTPAGTIPQYAADPSGTLRPTTLYYKLLAARKE